MRNSETQPKWQNYTCADKGTVSAEILRKMREVFRKTRFVAPKITGMTAAQCVEALERMKQMNPPEMVRAWDSFLDKGTKE